VVDAFVKSLFSNSLIRNQAESLAEVREKATVHIEAEEAIRRKRVNEPQKQGRYKVNSHAHNSKNAEPLSGRQPERKYVSNVAKSSSVREHPTRY